MLITTWPDFMASDADRLQLAVVLQALTATSSGRLAPLIPRFAMRGWPGWMVG